MQAREVLLVMTTLPDAAQAEALATHLVDGGLAACVNIMPPMRSVYRWQDRVANDQEHLLLMKTSVRRYPELEAAIRDKHPYELPEILALPAAGGSQDYLNWIGECCG